MSHRWPSDLRDSIMVKEAKHICSIDGLASMND